MLRHERHPDRTISDRELGIAALLLLVVMVVAAVIVPVFVTLSTFTKFPSGILIDRRLTR